MKKITVIDYGVGNLLSVTRAFEHCGAAVTFASKLDEIKAADRLVLPGVGAFSDGMQGLRDNGLIEALKEYVKTGKPLLGICLGMQMLFDGSQEFGEHEGLGLVSGTIKAIPNTTSDGVPHKIPAVGWGALQMPEGRRCWDGTILDGLKEGSAVYFVHSFVAIPEFDENRLADVYYNGRRLSAAITKDNVSGCQFHPEKSADAGLRIIGNFIRL